MAHGKGGARRGWNIGAELHRMLHRRGRWRAEGVAHGGGGTSDAELHRMLCFIGCYANHCPKTPCPLTVPKPSNCPKTSCPRTVPNPLNCLLSHLALELYLNPRTALKRHAPELYLRPPNLKCGAFWGLGVHAAASTATRTPINPKTERLLSMGQCYPKPKDPSIIMWGILCLIIVKLVFLI